MSRPVLSIVIPVYDRLELTQRCLQSVAANPPSVDHEFVVVDDGSDDGTGPWLDLQDRLGHLVAAHHPYNRGFAAACNTGAAHASGHALVFLNNDTQVLAGWAEPLVAGLADERVGAVGARLLFPSGRIQHGGYDVVDDPTGGGLDLVHVDRDRHDIDSAHPRDRREVLAVSAAAMAVRAGVFAGVGGFDEAYVNGYEDADLCLRLGERGLASLHEPASLVVHLEGGSGPQRHANDHGNLRRFRETWTGRVPVLADTARAA